MYRLKSKSNRILTLSACVTALSVMFASTATAQMAGIEACQATQDPAQRLQCYDALFPTSSISMSPKVESVESPTSKIEQAEKNFGDKTAQKKDDLVRPVIIAQKEEKVAKVKVPEITSISQQVSRIDTFGYKKLRVYLKNGQVWEQVGSVTRRPPKVSDKRPLIAEIKTGALGSFSLQFDGRGREIKVKRVR